MTRLSRPHGPANDLLRAGMFSDAVEYQEGRRDAGVLFLCDHASNALPAEYGSLGLPPAELERHIAFDIGAADVTRALARRFNAPALLTRYSRLLIDPNRGADDPTLVMRLSDGAVIPGNRHADAAEIARRVEQYWRPYRNAAAALVADMTSAAGRPAAIVSLHSFTPVWRGNQRPWQIGLLWDSDPRLAGELLRELQRDPELCVGDNEPYDGALVGDTMYQLGTSQGHAHVLIEVRQDLIDTPAGAEAWAGKLTQPLATALSNDKIASIEFFESRAGTGRRPALQTRDVSTPGRIA